MATPVLLTDDAFVNLSEADVSALLGQSLHTISLKKGGPWFQTSLMYFKLFLAHAADENQAITTASIYRRVMGLDNQALKPVVSAGVANSDRRARPDLRRDPHHQHAMTDTDLLSGHPDGAHGGAPRRAHQPVGPVDAGGNPPSPQRAREPLPHDDALRGGRRGRRD